MFYIELLSVTLPLLSLKLGKNIWGSMVLYARLLAFLVVKKIKKDGSGWRFSFFYNNRSFSLCLYEGSTDIAALSEIFLDGEYQWDAIRDPRVILDVGAHTGNTSIYFHLKYPDAKIYAIEASPQSYKYLCDNLSGYKNITPVFCALHSSDGEIDFYEAESSLGSSVVRRGREGKRVTVPATTLKTFFKKLNLERVDFIKIDIEGGEENVFLGNDPKEFSKYYVIEVHNDLMAPSLDFETKFFSNFEYTKRQIAPQRHLLYAYKE